MKNINNNRKKNIQKLLVRLELWFAPALILTPIVLSFFLIWHWYMRGFLKGSSVYDQELILGVLILLVNLFFDVLFVRSIRIQKQKNV